MREAQRAEGKPMRYDGRWRDRNASEAPKGVEPVIRFKAPREVGGFEADPLTQVEVLERVARADGAAGWCLAIQGGISGLIGGFLPARGAEQVFGDAFPWVAGAFAPSGTGRAGSRDAAVTSACRTAGASSAAPISPNAPRAHPGR